MFEQEHLFFSERLIPGKNCFLERFVVSNKIVTSGFVSILDYFQETVVPQNLGK